MVPENILDEINPDVASNTYVKRFIKTARRRFRSKSPNDVDHYLFLATCLYVLGDDHSAIALLEFLDENTGEYTCGRVDLAGSLASSRLMLAYIFEQHNATEKVHTMISREGIEHSMNVDNVEPEYRNLIQQVLCRASKDLEFYENEDDLTRTYYLNFCGACLLKLILVKGRLADIQHTIDDEDEADLLNGIEHYKNKFIGYLVPK